MPNREEGCELSEDDIKVQFELEMRYQTSPAMGVLRLMLQFDFDLEELKHILWGMIIASLQFALANRGWSDQFNISQHIAGIPVSITSGTWMLLHSLASILNETWTTLSHLSSIAPGFLRPFSKTL